MSGILTQPLVHRLIAERARLAPESVAVDDGVRWLTYGELDSLADGLARRLRAEGVGPEVRVGLFAERSVELVLGALAVLKAGGAYVPLDPRYPRERLAFLLEDSRAPVVLTQGHLAADLPAGGARVLVIETMIETAEVLRTAAPPDGAGRENLAYVIYTSGSTGRPKGVQIQHASLSWLVHWHLERFGFAAGDRVSQVASPSFDASVWEIWPTLASGASLHIPDEETRSSPRRMIRWFAERRINHGFLPTPLAEAALDEAWPEGIALRSLSTGGDRLRRWPGSSLPGPLINVYGPTETTVLVTCSTLEPGVKGEGLPPVGRPLPGAWADVLDPDRRPVPQGEVGEVWIGGAGLARGYLGQPALTAERFTPDPYAGKRGTEGDRLYRTGDLGRYLPDGSLDIIGRIDHQVKIRGFRIELGEIEAALVAHPGVREGVVLAREDGPGGPRLVAYLTPHSREPETGEIREYLGSKLPEPMVPSAFVWLQALPLTPNGKVDRRALERLDVTAEPSAEYVAPRTAVEEALAGVWAEVLGLHRVGIQDRFVDLGGHSLLAMQVLSRVRRLFGVELSIRALFESPTIEALARRVEREEAGTALGPALSPVLLPVPRDRELPLSFAQARLWFLDRLEPDSTVYNMPMAYLLRGRLAPAALAASLGEIVRRHEALRTRFSEGANGPVQVIEPAGAFVLPQVDLGTLPETACRREEERLTAAAARRSFDLARGPLFRALLLRAGESEWALVLAMHHVVSDGWSMGVMLREIETLYGAALAGSPSPLPELAVQYADFAVWQREWLRGEVLESQLAYWRERLAGHPPVLELPADRPRPAARTFRGASEPVVLGARLTERLKALSRGRGEPLFMTALAGFLAFLHRYTGRTDLLVGTPSAGRTRVELEGLIGFFVNTLVLRTDAAGDPAFAELTDRARESALGAYAHGDLPLERIVEELAPERSLGYSPLFQVAFALQTAPVELPRLPGVEIAPLPLPVDTAMFDLTVSLADSAGGLAGDLEYNRDLFDVATARRMASHLSILLEGVAGDPAARLSELPLLSAAERRELLVEWNDTARQRPWAPLVHELVAAQARQRPDAVAVALGDRRLTYGELEARSNRLAHALRSLGVGPEVLVAVCAERTPERVVGLLAVLKAGGAFVALDPAYPRERLAYLVEDARASVILTEHRLLGRLPESAATVISLDRDLYRIAADELRPPESGLRPESLAYVVYTSGSTGRPKGVAISHQGLLNLVHWHRETYDLTGADRGTLVASPAFDASVWELWPLLAAGAGAYIPDEETRLSAARIVRWWAEQEITVAFLPTPLAEAVLEEEIPSGLDLRLRALVVGGDRLHRPPRPGTPFLLVNHYGPSEYSVVTTAAPVPPAPRDAGGFPPIGRPISNTRVYVLDAHRQPVPKGVAGELHVGGAGLARGYLGRPELTAERFLPDPWGASRGEPGERMYRTGDLVRWLADGSLDFLGRIDHQVKVRGMRVELGEIEAVLARHPGVREAVVLAREDGAGSRRLAAYAVPAGPAPDIERVQEHLRAELPEYMLPSALVWLEAMPLTPNGKLDRRALERIELAAEPGADSVEPRTEVERALAGIWAERLGLERIGVREDFFQSGGHSLLAVQVLSRVRRLFGVELSVRTLFESPTVEALARRIERAREEAGRDAGPALLPVPRGRELPLSFAQARLWFLDRVQPGSAVYNMPMAYRLRGELEPGALAAALREIVRRHEALRTRFVEGADGPAQVVDPLAVLALPQVDLAGLPEPVRRREEERLTAAEALRPFDLARGPLFRPLLLRAGGSEWVLVLAMHHIVSDGWSMGVLLRELGELYGALCAGTPSRLPELPVQYADFAVWQRKWLRGKVLGGELAYWRERLAGHPPVLELPADRPRPAAQTFRGSVEPLSLGTDLSERLRTLSRQSGASLFMTLLAGFLALLQRYTGQTDLLVGTPTAGRTRVELERLIGFFVNLLALRTDASGDPSFAELLGRARQGAVGAYAHGDLPFERLVEELAPERNLGHSPLFQVLCALQTGSELPEIVDLEIEQLPLSIGAAKFDLTLSLTETADGLAGGLEYNRDLFDAATARRMAGHLRNLLIGAAEAPATHLSELPLLSAAERRELVEWNATRAPFPGERSIHGLFAERARRNPEALAVIAGGGRITYGELDARANALAGHLRAAGVRPEALVALCAERSIGMVVAMLAILKAGGAYVPLDPSYPGERLAFLLADTGVSVLLTQERLAASLPTEGLRVILLDRDEEPAGEIPPEPATGGGHLAYVIYTSGSTGRPKGVAVPHRAVLRLVLNTNYVQLGSGARVAQAANASFDAATFEIWGPLLNGGSLAILPQDTVLSPAALAADIRRHGIRTMFLTTALFNQVAREAPQAFEPLTDLLFGGEAVDPGWVRAVLRDGPPKRLLHVYGPTENTTFSTWFEIRRVEPGAMTVPIGRPIANTRACVLDPDFRPVPVGVYGSLYVGGDGLARGYLHRPELTAERFVPDPFAGEAGGEPGGRIYATGDLVRYLPDGDLEFLGRADQQVKIRGFRIELGEIEAVLAGHPQIREVAVLAREEAAGKRLVAYVAVRGTAPDAGEIREYLKSKLPDYMVPSAFVWLETLPLTPNGKVDRRALTGIEVKAQAEGYVAPGTAVEEMLAGIWAELLGLDRVGVRDDFFHLGGHSLLATRVLARVRHLLGVELDVRSLFDSPTVEALAQLIERDLLDEMDGEDGPVLLPVPRDRELPLSFAQARLWFLDRVQPGSAVYNMPMAYRLRGELAPGALAASLSEIVRRHEALRTRFVGGADGPAQVIDPPGILVLPRVDLTGLPEPARRREEGRLTAVEALRPFDLARGPLFRPLLLRAGGSEWVLVLAMHHIVSDGWSMGVLLRELGELYGALRAGAASPLPELPVQYADFAVWQREWLRGEVLEGQLAYWRERLAGHPPVLELPADRPRPAARTFRGGMEPLSLGTDLSERLRTLSRQSGAPLFMTALAGFLALLQRYTGQTDLLVGTPAAGRGRMELEGLIGFFVNTLVLRTDASGDPAFAELLGRTRQAALGAYEHGDLPFERLVEELAPERNPGHPPLFQVMFVLETGLAEPPGIADLEIEELELSIEAAKFDLTVSLRETAAGITGSVEYDRDLFDAATIRRLAGHLRNLLAGAVERPGARLSELPLLSVAERGELLLELNDTARVYPPAGLVHELFAAHARRRPEAEAVALGERRLTFGELEARSNRLAHHLRSLGVGPDVVVGVCTERTLERVVGIVAILKAGGAYASFDPAYPPERLAFLIADARVPVLLTERDLLDRLPESSAAVVCLDRSLDRWAGDESRPPAVEVDPENLAYVIFTSGSTGRPKGVAIPHRGLLNLVLWHHETYGVNPADRGTQVASPAFDVSVWELWPLLAAGAGTVIPDQETRLSPSRMLRWWAVEGITLAFLPTPLADAILGEEIPADLDLPVRYLVVGGDRLHRHPRPGTSFQLSNIYGPAEHSVVTSMALVPPAREPAAGRLPSIGRVIANTRVYVLDAQGQPVPRGLPGELYVGGAGLARGYIWRPELTAERFLPDPWGALRGEPGARMYRTGDLVRWLPDGELDFLGRIDHQVKLRGMRVELGEIEAVLGQHPDVREAVTLVREGRLTAYVVSASQASLDELRGFLERQVPAYMVPQDWALLDALPLTPNGKVDREALARIDVRSAAPGEDLVAPRTAVEEALARVWAELLGLERVRVREDFFRLGGHSLLAVQVLSRVRRLFGVELGIRELFQSPTVEALGRAVERARQAAGPALAPVPRDGELPLSFSQTRLWFLERLQPGASLYNLPTAYRLSGDLAPGALASSLEEIVRRHEALRTRFVEGVDGPAQVVDPPETLVLPLVDLADLPEPARRREEERLTAAEALRPFELARGPLFRPLLLRAGGSEWVLVLAMHHIVSDGWSMGVLLRELGELYGALLAGAASPLPELPVQYADFAVWQREWLRGEVLEGQLAYWRERLAGHPPVLELPADRPRPAAQTFRGGVEPLSLGTDLSERLRTLSRQSGAPLFMTALAGFLALLQRYTGQADLLAGTPAAGRSRMELEGLIGFFVNTLVLRTDASGDPAFGELLGRARQAALGAYEHGDLPFERLVEELAPERNLGHSPLFQVMFVLETGLAEPPEIADLEIEEMELSIEAAKFDLTVSLRETATGITGSVEYNRDLFDAATIRRLADHLRNLLAGAVERPEARLSELPLLSVAERGELLLELNDTMRAYPPFAPVHELFAAHARRRPDAVAVTLGERRLTFGELEARSNRLAHHLRRLGVGPDVVVGVCTERTLERVVGIVAILKAGGAYASFDPAYPPERLAFLIADARVTVLLTEQRLLDRLPESSAALVCLDRDLDRWAGDESRAPAVEIDPENLAYVIFTSGSTGRPKGVAIPHRGLLNLVFWHHETYGVSPADRGTQVASPAFDVSVWELWPLLAAGAGMVIPDEETRLSPSRMLRWWAEEGITLAFLPTPLADAILSEEIPAELDLRLRYLVVGGDRLHRHPRPGTSFQLSNIYGPAEHSVVTSMALVSPARESAAGRLPLIGRVIGNTRVYVLDAYQQPVPRGVPGELYVGGAGLARGYIWRPELTAERFLPDPWGALRGEPGTRMYRTGDLVRWLPDGNLDFLGRVDHQVKLRGMRVELGEIEAVLGQHPDVREVVTLLREGRLTAYVVVGPQASLDELRGFLERQVPAYMVPQDWALLDALPLTPNGKVDRRALPAPDRRIETMVAPRTPLEELMAEIWAEVLFLDRVGIHDSFWDLGGHSLLATKVLSRVNESLGVELPLQALFRSPTIAGFTAAIGESLLAEEQGNLELELSVW